VGAKAVVEETSHALRIRSVDGQNPEKLCGTQSIATEGRPKSNLAE